MLRSLKDLERYTACATDGDVGGVENFLVDDERWVVRYLVVAAGGLLGGRRVLISPISVRQAEWVTHRLHLALTTEKIKGSPSVDLDKPVSRQHEQDYFRYYGYHYYWGALGLWGMGSHPDVLVHSERDDGPPAQPQAQSASTDVHLRSVDEVRGYSVEGTDGTLGHVADFVIDDDSWAVRYLVIDVGHWWSGKKVLVAPHWATRISWSERKVHLDLARATVKGSPAWDPAAAVNREYEARLYDYYGRPVYWPTGGSTDAAKPPHTR